MSTTALIIYYIIIVYIVLSEFVLLIQLNSGQKRLCVCIELVLKIKRDFELQLNIKRRL